MANSLSALKRGRQTKTRTAENRAVKTRVKNARKAALAALESGDAEAIKSSLNTLFSTVDRAVKRGTMHRNSSKRVKSTFMARARAAS